MKKIINGKLYNTEKATMLFEWDNKYPVNDSNYVKEVLYRTKNRRYFIYGIGGPNTIYAESNGGNWDGGCSIIPIDEKQARTWGEKHMDIDSYIKEFGEVEEA